GAEEAGADAALLISPYYNRPTQDGIYRHYAAVAEASRLPLIVYNIPGRTGSNITPDTMARLARIPNVAGVKEASGNLAQVIEIIDAAGPDFGVYSGDDPLTLPIMAAGGRGVIAVGANLLPRAYRARTRACGWRARSRRLATPPSGETRTRWRAAPRSACASAPPSPRSAGPSRSSSTSRRPPRPWRTRASPPSAARAW